ncbi:hypothetical protein K501DRAFT_278142 [Backusella circina FSU 941]|nr:hypothetical protein K501DRAFT_278142 [Backusella circina FSU 941]
MKFVCFILVVVSLAFVVNAASVYKREEALSGLIEDAPLGTKHEKNIADSIVQVVDKAIEKKKADNTAKSPGSTKKPEPRQPESRQPESRQPESHQPEPHQPSRESRQFTSHERMALYRALTSVQHTLRSLGSISKSIESDQKKLLSQYEAFKKYASNFGKQLSFFEGLGMGGKGKEDN